MFLRKINFLYNKHSPLITCNRKNKQDPSKPWLTPGIIKSIRIKKNWCEQFCQATNPVQIVSLHQKLKSYRNQIIILNCLCKENYFKVYFETNKNDSKKIWYDVKTLIYIKTSKNISQKLYLNIDNETISDDHIIATHFYSFSISIAGKLLRKIPKTFHSFLTKSNAKTFFLSLTTPEEVLNELKTFNLNHSHKKHIVWKHGPS